MSEAAATTPAAETPASTDAGTAITDTSAAAEDVECISFKITYGKEHRELKRKADSTVSELKAEVEQLFQVPPDLQKLLSKGKPLADGSSTLRQAGIKSGAKMLLIGSSREAIKAADKPKETAAPTQWDAPVVEEPLSKQTHHAKVLGKGKPEDALPGLAGLQSELPAELTAIPGLLNSQGNKVRLTFKDELKQLWIGSATSTQKVPYCTISKIEATPIDGEEGYSILALYLGSGGASKYWLYFYPSHLVRGLKTRIMGPLFGIFG